jgi:hypothetical protein
MASPSWLTSHPKISNNPLGDPREVYRNIIESDEDEGAMVEAAQGSGTGVEIDSSETEEEGEEDNEDEGLVRSRFSSRSRDLLEETSRSAAKRPKLSDAQMERILHAREQGRSRPYYNRGPADAVKRLLAGGLREAKREFGDLWDTLTKNQKDQVVDDMVTTRHQRLDDKKEANQSIVTRFIDRVDDDDEEEVENAPRPTVSQRIYDAAMRAQTIQQDNRRRESAQAGPSNTTKQAIALANLNEPNLPLKLRHSVPQMPPMLQGPAQLLLHGPDDDEPDDDVSFAQRLLHKRRKVNMKLRGTAPSPQWFDNNKVRMKLQGLVGSGHDYPMHV